MRMHIRIRLDVLSASVGRVVISRSGADTALVGDAVLSASSTMLWLVVVVVMKMMMVVIMRQDSCLLLLCASDSSAVAEVVAVAVADEALTPGLNVGNVSPANALSTGCKIDKSWIFSARS
jgi:hypothetical protein